LASPHPSGRPLQGSISTKGGDGLIYFSSSLEQWFNEDVTHRNFITVKT